MTRGDRDRDGVGDRELITGEVLGALNPSAFRQSLVNVKGGLYQLTVHSAGEDRPCPWGQRPF